MHHIIITYKDILDLLHIYIDEESPFKFLSKDKTRTPPCDPASSTDAQEYLRLISDQERLISTPGKTNRLVENWDCKFDHYYSKCCYIISLRANTFGIEVPTTHYGGKSLCVKFPLEEEEGGGEEVRVR